MTEFPIFAIMFGDIACVPALIFKYRALSKRTGGRGEGAEFKRFIVDKYSDCTVSVFEGLGILVW